MKQYSTIVLISLMITGIFWSCKKDTAQDYTPSVKGKTWWGTLSYTGKEAEYYSVYFNENNDVVWSQLSGDYPGKWVVKGRQLTMTFSGINAEIKADISDDSTLTNIVDNTTEFNINSAELLVNPKLPLDNTVWEGEMDYGSSTVPIRITFSPGDKIKFESAVISGTYTYLRSASGGVIRFSNAGVVFFFGIMVSDREMRGSYGYTWKVVKK